MATPQTETPEYYKSKLQLYQNCYNTKNFDDISNSTNINHEFDKKVFKYIQIIKVINMKLK